MDQHKFSSGRLRKRASDFSELSRRMEDSDDGVVRLTAPTVIPAVTIEFGPILKPRDLDAEQFDLDDADNRVVAEAYCIARNIPTLVFIADDSLPIRLARLVGLPCVRPPKSWRRPTEGDERDEIIADLKRQLGPQPKLVLRFPGARDDTRRHDLAPPPTAICRDCINRIVQAALDLDPEVPRSVLESRYPSAVPMTFGNYAMPNFAGPGSVSTGMLDRYEREYVQYERHLRLWASKLPKLLARSGMMLPLYVEIGNEGDRAADRLHLEATLHGDFHFASLDHFDALLEGVLEVPQVPRPMLSPDFFPDTLGAERRRVDEFYAQDEPADSAPSTKMISWRCEEFRQGTRFNLPTIIVALSGEARGAITVVARSALQAKPVTLTAPLKASADPMPGPFYRFLREHLELVPAHYRSALASELAREGQPCSCLEL
jgi:hypothetical protein